MVAKPDQVRSETPGEESGLRLDKPETTAGGLPAITEVMKHVMGEPGVPHGTQLLRSVNQFEGFDCPGCAWPEPDDRRSIAEFCENGAKAVGEEATPERVTPEFFREWSVAALSEQSDFWLGRQGRLTHPMILREGATHYEPIDWDDAFRLIGARLNALALARSRPSSTRPDAPATRPHFCTSCSCASSAPTICRTAPTCATNPAARA